MDGVQVGFGSGSVMSDGEDAYNLALKEASKHKKWESSVQVHMIAFNKIN